MKQRMILKMQLMINGRVNKEYRDSLLTRASENAYYATLMCQQRASRDEATHDYENAANDKRTSQ